MKIGIAITTRNRPEVLKTSLENWHKFMPSYAELVIVDDASYYPHPEAFRFEKQVGVGAAKNKCLELLEDCDEIFLADDDVYPTCYYWYLYYTSSKLNHACMTFGRKVLNKTVDYIETEKPCGCLLYANKVVIDIVGGFDNEFKGYGLEHVNWTDRIFNNGLTPARYVDIPESLSLFHSMDMYGEVQSSFTAEDRMQIPNNLHLYQQKYYSKEFKPFK